MINAAHLIPFLDLTSLQDTDTAAHSEALCKQAQTPHGAVAAVCIMPAWVALAVKCLRGTGIAVATVANFPHGNQEPQQVVADIKAAIAAGATEIDVVLPYCLIQQGQGAAALSFVQRCRQACGKQRVLKIILETGLLNAQQIADAALVAIDGGANFIKTSTGKVLVGATQEAVRVMLEVLRRYPDRAVGLKVSGGIRTVADALVYTRLATQVMGEAWLTPAHFRLGTSQLLQQILSVSPSP